jgi:aryl-alcohol dehydrogenase-like predicted oxidoreductase
MPKTSAAGVFPLASRSVNRMGYGAMQLAGPGVFGPPKDRGAAITVLREAVASGVNHIDTSDFYGPHVTNQIIREALHPYPDDLIIVTKVGAVRGQDASWMPAQQPDDFKRAVDDNLENLGVEALDVVNLRITGDVHAPTEGSIETRVRALAELKRQGLIRHIGLSNVTSAQVAEAQTVAEIVCVQNHYIWSTGRTTRSSTNSRPRESPTCRSSRSAASRLFNRRRSRRSPRSSERRRCRRRSPGCSAARPTFF